MPPLYFLFWLVSLAASKCTERMAFDVLKGSESLSPYMDACGVRRSVRIRRRKTIVLDRDNKRWEWKNRSFPFKGKKRSALREVNGTDLIYITGPYSQHMLEAAWKILRPRGVMVGNGYCSSSNSSFPRCIGCDHRRGGKLCTKPSTVGAWLVAKHPWLRLYHRSKSDSWWVRKSVSAKIGSPRGRGRFILSPGWKRAYGVLFNKLEINPVGSMRRLDEENSVASASFGGKTLTVAYLYYMNSVELQKQAEFWMTWPQKTRDAVAVVIIDDGSPNKKARLEVASMVFDFIDITVIEICQDVDWNIGGARNLAMHFANTEFVLLMDIDLVVQSSTLDSLVGWISVDRRADVLMYFPRINAAVGKPKLGAHPATVLISKSAYWSVGGCDEDFVGHYGYTDPHFRYRVKKTTKVNLLDIREAMPHMIPLLQLESHSHGKSGKNSTHNRELFMRKKDGSIEWAQDYIRFTWAVVGKSHLNSSNEAGGLGLAATTCSGDGIF